MGVASEEFIGIDMAELILEDIGMLLEVAGMVEVMGIMCVLDEGDPSVFFIFPDIPDEDEAGFRSGLSPLTASRYLFKYVFNGSM